MTTERVPDDVKQRWHEALEGMGYRLRYALLQWAKHEDEGFSAAVDGAEETVVSMCHHPAHQPGPEDTAGSLAMRYREPLAHPGAQDAWALRVAARHVGVSPLRLADLLTSARRRALRLYWEAELDPEDDYEGENWWQGPDMMFELVCEVLELLKGSVHAELTALHTSTTASSGAGADALEHEHRSGAPPGARRCQHRAAQRTQHTAVTSTGDPYRRTRHGGHERPCCVTRARAGHKE